MQEEKSIKHSKSVDLSNSVIIGLNRIGILEYNRIKEQPRIHHQVAGIVDVYDEDAVDIPQISDVKILGNIQRFDEIVKKYNIRHAFIAIDTKDVALLHRIYELCRRSGVIPEIVSESQDIIYGHTVGQIFQDLHRPIEISLRRLFDFVNAFILFILFLPLWVAVGLMIKLDSKGPILYSQERVGKNGRIFRIFKFRSMYTDAEKLTGPTLATKNDPRITKVGLFLRKTRLDEIPQLINVLIGDMSFVGPRPERPYFVEKYSKEIPLYKRRLQIKPGVTGLAQVSTGYDSDLEDVKTKLKYDLTYVENCSSLPHNIKILFKTLWVAFTAQGQ